MDQTVSFPDKLTGSAETVNPLSTKSPEETRAAGQRGSLTAIESRILSIDAGIRLMDHLNESGFHAWVKDQRNVALSTYHLSRVMSDYPAEKIADGLRWLFEDWQLINVAVALRIMLFEGRASLEAGVRQRVLQRLTIGWQRKHVEHLVLLLRQPSRILLAN